MGVKRIPERNGYKSEGNTTNANILTLETDSVSPQALKCLLEELLAFGRHSRNVVLLPFNGSVDILKYFLDRLGNLVTNTVSGNESDLSGSGGTHFRICH